MRPACPRLFEVEAMRDGRLTGPERASFGRHMATCRVCAGEAQALDELARAVRTEGAPADELQVARARTRLLADFDRGLVASGTSSPRRWLLWSATAVAVACGLFVASRARLRPPPVGGSGAVVASLGQAVWSKQVDGDAETIVLERGALAIHVVHTASPRRRLVVVLPDGELEDIGTTFTVRAGDGRTKEVAVQEGSVLLRLRGSAPIAVSAGQTWTANAGATSARAPAPETRPEPKREPRRIDKSPLRRARTALEPDEPAQSREFRAAVGLLDRGDGCEAARRFAAYVASYPDDPRAEDAAYLRVIALQRCGADDDMKAAARDFLRRYPAAFRRAEVDRLTR